MVAASMKQEFKAGSVEPGEICLLATKRLMRVGEKWGRIKTVPIIEFTTMKKDAPLPNPIPKVPAPCGIYGLMLDMFGEWRWDQLIAEGTALEIALAELDGHHV